MEEGRKATLRAADFLILEALNRRPMSNTELARALHISRSSIAARIKRFQKLGLIIRQWPDRRWVIKLIVRVETPHETLVEEGLDTTTLPEPPIQPQKVPQKPLQTSVRAREDAPTPIPDLGGAEPPPKPYRPLAPTVQVSDKALKLSKQFRLPASLVKYGGEVNVGRMASCKECGTGTPFKYGPNPRCPKCARRGH